MKSLCLIFFTFILFSCNSTKEIKHFSNYTIINETIYNILEINEESVVYLYKNSIPIDTMLEDGFFTERYLEEVYGQGGILGVDSEKVMKFLEEVNLKNLKITNTKSEKWKTKYFEFPFKFANADSNTLVPKQKQFNLSMPLFIDDKHFFIYYDYNCGDLCGQGNIKVFKKEGNNWIEYLKLPIWIS